MTATNHVLTGALIAVVVHNPVVALPAAFLSHFVLDAIPHYGNKKLKIDSSGYRTLLVSDMSLAAYFLAFLLIVQPPYAWLAVACGILAASPDLMWIPDFIAETWHKKSPVYGPIRRFHTVIQWYQRLPGTVIELAWGIGMLILLRNSLFY